MYSWPATFFLLLHHRRLLYYFVKDLNLFRAALVGFGSVYALGFVGYMLMPAIGPLQEMGARSGGWLTETGGAFIAQRTNGVDVFPSIHMAASLFLLMFDFQYRRAHFWWCWRLRWVCGFTVYLRYHYGVDLVAGIGLAFGCVWLTRWYVRSRLCAELEAEMLRIAVRLMSKFDGPRIDIESPLIHGRL